VTRNRTTNLCFSVHDTYPRLWSDWGRRIDRALCCNYESKTKEIKINNQKKISFPTLVPEMLRDREYTGTPQFVNEIKLNIYSNDSELFGKIYAR
jgi:hypothetical protein